MILDAVRPPYWELDGLFREPLPAVVTASKAPIPIHLHQVQIVSAATHLALESSLRDAKEDGDPLPSAETMRDAKLTIARVAKFMAESGLTKSFQLLSAVTPSGGILVTLAQKNGRMRCTFNLQNDRRPELTIVDGLGRIIEPDQWQSMQGN